jgi:hypothetical protein
MSEPFDSEEIAMTKQIPKESKTVTLPVRPHHA